MTGTRTRVPDSDRPTDAGPPARKPSLRIETPAALGREQRALARDALIARLRGKAAEADAGLTIDTTGLSDEAFIALLRR